MAIPSPAYWYVNFGDGSTTGYYALTKWATGTVTAAGAIVRQNTTPAVGSERVFICIIAGTTHATTEPTWVTTKGAKTTDNTVTWMECTGQAALNGSLTYTSGWTSGPGGVGTGVKNQAVALGYIIARDSGASYQICTTAGTAGNGSEPSFSNTAGTTTADNTVTWTSLGVVGNFTTAFGAPHARLGNAYVATWGAAGDIFWIGNNSAETGTTASTVPPGTVALPNWTYSVDHTKTSPGTADLVAGASLTYATAASALRINGYNYIFGLSVIIPSTGAFLTIGSNSATNLTLDTCTITMNAANPVIFGGGTNNYSRLTCISCTFNGSAITGWVPRIQTAVFKGGSFGGSALPTPAFSSSGAGGSIFLFDGVDFSAFGSGKTLFADLGGPGACTLLRCKLGASVTVAASLSSDGGGYIDVISSDSGATSYRQERYRSQATLTQETTIVRSGGASDGTTSLSWKVVSTANIGWVAPFESFPIAIWNDTTGSSVTATVEIVASGSLNNDDVWMEVEYLGSSSTPQASFANSTKANNLATGTANTSSTATWASSPGTAMKMSVSFTPQMAGDVIVRVYVAKASQTVYIDPVVTLSPAPRSKTRQRIIYPGIYVNDSSRLLVHPGMHGGMRG